MENESDSGSTGKASTAGSARRLFSVYPSRNVDLSHVDGVFKDTIEIANESDDKIGFRVMTNAKDEYSVSPAGGFIPKNERLLVTIEMRSAGNFDPSHLFIINVHPAGPEDTDRKEFWSRLRGTNVIAHKMGVKYPKLDEGRTLERLVKQMAALKTEMRLSRSTIESQARLIGELRDSAGSCHHPSSLVVFVIALVAIGLVFVLLNRGMRGELYREAIRPLL